MFNSEDDNRNLEEEKRLIEGLKRLRDEPIDERHRELLTLTLFTRETKYSEPSPPAPPPTPLHYQPSPLLQFYNNFSNYTTNPNLNYDPNYPLNPNPIFNSNPNPNPNPSPSTSQPIRTSQRKRRCKMAQQLRPGKTETIPPPYEWATSHRAKVHTLQDLLSKRIEKISDELHCKRCEKRFTVEFDVAVEFAKIKEFIAARKNSMADRAPKRWENPTVPDCGLCGQKGCTKPVISQKKREINWLFLLLGEFIGFCSLEQLKYFCKHTENHRTGAKDRLLYLTYLGICKQLDPSGPFDVLC